MKTASRKKGIFVKIAIIALVVYAAVSIIQLQLQIRDSEQRLDALLALQASQLNIKNGLLDQISNRDLYLEQQARLQGMAKPGETVLIEIPQE